MLATGVLPYQRTRFATKHNRHAIVEQSRKFDAVICSWEPLDALVRRLSPPSILITHNVASRALPAMFPNNVLATLAAARAGAWERRWYRSGHFAAIGALSRRDFAYLDGIRGRPELLLLPPGMPPCIKLKPDACFAKEIVISVRSVGRPSIAISCASPVSMRRSIRACQSEPMDCLPRR